MTTFIANAANLAVTPAGAITADNVQGALEELDTSGKHTIWVPAVAMYPSATSGAEWYAGESGPTLKGLAFDPATDEYAEFAVVFPKSWDEGTLTAQFYWMTTVDATPEEDVIWGIRAKACSNNVAFAGAFGTEEFVTDGTQDTFVLRVTSETDAITVGNSPSAGDLITFKISRDANHASDTAVNDAILLGVKLIFTTDAANDD